MRRQTKLLAYSALMCALIVISTLFFKFTIPGTDVLFTTQVFFVLLCGQLLPPRYCAYSIGAYIFIGLLGFPVFSAAAGPMVVVTPSFGYLLGFPFAAVIEARLLGRSRTLRRRFFAAFAGLIALYSIALGFIAALSSLYIKAPIGFEGLMSAYCMAFLPLDLVKAVSAAYVGRRLEIPLRLNREA